MPSINRPLYHRQPGNSNRGSSGNDLSRDIPQEYRRRVGIWLRDMRTDGGMRQQDLGDALGVGFTTISSIENGRSAIPPDRYETLAEILGVPNAEFGKLMLRYSNPWAYGMIYGFTKALREELGQFPNRNGTNAGLVGSSKARHQTAIAKTLS